MMMVDIAHVKHLGPTIAFAGPNGAGKSTLARRLATDLRQEGKSVTLIREPGGSPGAEEIRRLILEGDADRWSPWTETLLFMAARQDHLEKTIWPGLARGDIVISDRYLLETRVFQLIKDESLEHVVEGIVKLLSIPEAQHTLLIDVTPSTSRARLNARAGAEADRFELLGDDFEFNVRNRFLALAYQQPTISVIDGSKSEDDVYRAVRDTLRFHDIC
jgi:dTMP kinase